MSKEERRERRKVWDRKYNEANKEKIAAHNKAYNEANKEKRKAYYLANKEKIDARNSEYTKKWRKINSHEPLVYFTMLKGFVKIGWSTMIKVRMHKLRFETSRHPVAKKGNIELLGAIPGDRKLEQELHEKFNSARHGDTEWFEATPEILEYIKNKTDLK